jgi:hypothetical protein
MKRKPSSFDMEKQTVAQGVRLKAIDEKIDLHYDQYMQRLNSIDSLLTIQNNRIRDVEKTANNNRGAGIFISALFTVLLIVIALLKT